MHLPVIAETPDQAREFARTMAHAEPRAVHDAGPASSEDVGRVMSLMAPAARAFAEIAGTTRRVHPTL